MAEMDEEEEDDDEESYHGTDKRGTNSPPASAGAMTSALNHRPRLSPDAHLSPELRRSCYVDPAWRIEVSLTPALKVLNDGAHNSAQ